MNRRPRRVLLRALAGLALALVVGTAWEAGAQTIEFRGFQERHDRVQREMERTQELWTEVSARAGKSNLPGVRALVEQARTVQTRAKDSLIAAQNAGQSDGMATQRMADQHLQNCLTLTLRARDLTVRAARQLREDLSQEESARRTIERVKQQLERIDNGDERRVNQARELVERAESQWRDGRFEQALRLAQNANSVLSTIESRPGDRVDENQVATTLERVRERFERAKASGADSRRLGAIERLLDQAQRALDAGRPREAAQRVLTARRNLDELGTADGDGNRTERALERLDAQIERVQSRFEDRLDESGQRLLRQAGQARDRAQRAFDDGNEEQAQQHIRAAADLLARLQRRAGGR